MSSTQLEKRLATLNDRLEMFHDMLASHERRPTYYAPSEVKTMHKRIAETEAEKAEIEVIIWLNNNAKSARVKK
jgi:hypothetical protein